MPRAKLQLPDWPFGATTRRLLLEALLVDRQPADGWTKRQLEQRAGVRAGGLDEVLGGAVQLGLVERREDSWHVPEPLPEIADPLTELVRRARRLPAVAIQPPPTRVYRRGNSP